MTRRMIVALAAAAFALLLGCVGRSAQGATPPAKPYDFDGDGRPELVAAAPGLTVRTSEESIPDAGGVVVLTATSHGLSSHRRLITQLTIGGYPEDVGGRFGSHVVSADFDRDGYADLVTTAHAYAGHGELDDLLAVVPGSARGLDVAHASGLYNPADEEDALVGLWGPLVAADLTGDGYPDLAVGVPYSRSGEVLVFAGGPHGLADVPVRTLHGRDEDEDFGSSLAAGDLDGDGAVDLAVGSSGETSSGANDPGSVSVCPGALGGPSGCTPLLHSAAVAGPTSLAIGRVTGGSRPDLVVAVPSPTKDAPGSVLVVQLKPTGAVAIDHKLVLSQAAPGVPGSDERGDAFGSALAVGDLDGDGLADLVIGSAGEDHGSGRVTIVHGAPGGWRTVGNASYGQSTRGVPGKAEKRDGFGSSLALLDHDGDGRLDLDVGSPGENGSGLVTAFRGVAGGLTTHGSRAFSLRSLKIRHAAGADFGDPLGG